jgi:prepilin-type N-terminal cleavage/methylation domain-containing protein
MMRRRGLSLIELLAVMTINSSVLVLLTVWLVMLLRGSDAGQQHLLWTMTQDRLARQFRHDVHEAVALSNTDDSVLLRLQADSDRTIAYRLADGRLLREEFSGDKRLRQETYRLSAAVELSVESQRKLDQACLALVMSPREPRTSDASATRLRIEAQLGLLHRWSGSPPQEESP